MAGYTIFTTEEFDRDFERLDKSVQMQIEAELNQVQNNPFVGKPLGYPFFREKKVHNLRMFYLIYKEYVIVFIIALSDKKDQQETIDKIKYLMPYYKDEIRKKFTQ
jgi:mRNA-degrading endonuclease RelE of RelBE toxin-antitoxin system